MKNKISILVAVSLAVLSLFAGVTYAENTQKMEIDFFTAKEMALKNSEKYAIQSDITSSISKKYEEAKKDPYQIYPLSTEYDGMEKIEHYSLSRTKDWKYLDKSQRQALLNAKIENTNKTLQLFTSVVELENTLDYQELELEKAKADLRASESMLKSGYITKVDHNSFLIAEKTALDNMNSTAKKLQLEREKLASHMGIDGKDYHLVLTVPEKILSPQDALANSQNINTSFKDLQEDIDKLNEHLDTIKRLNLGPDVMGNIEKQQEKIDDKTDDYKELSKDTLHSLYSAENNILILANQILSYEIELKIAQNNLEKISLLHSQGLVIPIKKQEEKINIDSIKLNIIKNHLNIENLIEEYTNTQIL